MPGRSEASAGILNTVVITAFLIGVLTLSTLAGYALARFHLPGENIIFFTFILGLMIPFFSVMIPLFYQLSTSAFLARRQRLSSLR